MEALEAETQARAKYFKAIFASDVVRLRIEWMEAKKTWKERLVSWAKAELKIPPIKRCKRKREEETGSEDADVEEELDFLWVLLAIGPPDEEEEKDAIAIIRSKWELQGNENKWRLLWQRAQEPAVHCLLLQAAQVASDLQL